MTSQTETPAQTLRRALPQLREQADKFIPQGPRAKFYAVVTELVEHIANDLADADAFECAPNRLVTSEEFPYRPDWTAALAVQTSTKGDTR